TRRPHRGATLPRTGSLAIGPPTRIRRQAMRVVPIEAPGADVASCGEEVGPVPKMHLPLARREFLQGSGILMGTLAAGSVLAVLAPSTAWALELKSLSTAEGQTLL